MCFQPFLRGWERTLAHATDPEQDDPYDGDSVFLFHGAENKTATPRSRPAYSSTVDPELTVSTTEASAALGHVVRAPENTMQQASRTQLVLPTLLSWRSCQHCAQGHQGHQGPTRLGVITASPAPSPPPPHVSYLISSRSPPSLPWSKTLISTPLNYCHTLPADLPSTDCTTSLPYQPF